MHPSCNAGGGGEKVLFCILKSLEKLDIDIIIYSGILDKNRGTLRCRHFQISKR